MSILNRLKRTTTKLAGQATKLLKKFIRRLMGPRPLTDLEQDIKRTPWKDVQDEVAAHPDKEDLIPFLLSPDGWDQKVLSPYGWTKQNWRDSAHYVFMRIGGPRAFGALLQLYQQLMPSVIRDDGTFVHVLPVEGEYGGKENGLDVEIASDLIGLPGAFDRLKSTLQPHELERLIIVSGGASTLYDEPKEQCAIFLAERGTPQAIGYLLSTRSTALRHAGQIAVPRMLKALASSPSAIPWRSRGTLKKNILDILRDIGNGDLVEEIMAAARTDRSIAEAAELAISEICLRCNAPLPPSLQSAPDLPLPMRKLDPTGDEFVDSCFCFKFNEFYEGRCPEEIDEARDFMKILQNDGLMVADVVRHNFAPACDKLAALRMRLPDFHFSYRWLGRLYHEAGRLDDARRVLDEGLRLARSKSEICEARARLEFGLGDMAEAVKWWIRNVVIQISSKQLEDYEPFLYLACVAPEFGQLGWVERLELRADTIRQVRFDVSLHRRVHARFQELMANPNCLVSVRKAMEILDTHFLST
jgi:tetratricopeptide (TPR) repeat protein